MNLQESSSVSVSEQPRKKLVGGAVLRFAGAIVCLIVGVISWIVMAELLQGLFKQYPQPYFLAYWIHSWYAVCYILWKVWREFPGNCQCNSSGDGALDWKKAFWVSAVVGVLGLASAYCWYLSLTRTSIPANTAIYQSAVAFVFVLSVPILRERITAVKVVSVIFAMVGVSLISKFSENDNSSSVKNTALGFVYLVISTVLYALLEVVFKKWATFKGDPSATCNGLRFVGLMGIHSLLWMWPPILILHYTFQPFCWPSPEVLKLMFVNAALDIFFNCAIFLCIALSSPLFASVGVVTAIPLSVAVDFVINRKTANCLVYLGMGLIAIGFAGFCISEFIAARKESKEELENAVY